MRTGLRISTWKDPWSSDLLLANAAKLTAYGNLRSDSLPQADKSISKAYLSVFALRSAGQLRAMDTKLASSESGSHGRAG